MACIKINKYIVELDGIIFVTKDERKKSSETIYQVKIKYNNNINVTLEYDSNSQRNTAHDLLVTGKVVAI